MEIKAFETSADSPLGFCAGLSSLNFLKTICKKTHEKVNTNFDNCNLTPILEWLPPLLISKLSYRKNKVIYSFCMKAGLHESESSNLERHLL